MVERNVYYREAKREGTVDLIEKIWLSEVVELERQETNPMSITPTVQIVLEMWRRGYIGLTINTTD